MKQTPSRAFQNFILVDQSYFSRTCSRVTDLLSRIGKFFTTTLFLEKLRVEHTLTMNEKQNDAEVNGA